MVFLSRAQLFFKIVLQTKLVEKYGVNDRPKWHGFAREDIQDYWWKDDFQGDFARYPLILLLIQVHVHQQYWDQQKIISIKIASIKIANINCQTELLPPIHNKCWGLSSKCSGTCHGIHFTGEFCYVNAGKQYATWYVRNA